MKENLKRVAKYFTNIFYVALVAPVIFAKAILNPMLSLIIALIYAILNDHDKASEALNGIADKFE